MCSSQAAAACFALGFAAASVSPTQGLRGTALYVNGGSVFGQSGSPFGPNGFDGGMGMGMGMGGAIKTPSYKNEGY